MDYLSLNFRHNKKISVKRIISIKISLMEMIKQTFLKLIMMKIIKYCKIKILNNNNNIIFLISVKNAERIIILFLIPKIIKILTLKLNWKIIYK